MKNNNSIEALKKACEHARQRGYIETALIIETEIRVRARRMTA